MIEITMAATNSDCECRRCQRSWGWAHRHDRYRSVARVHYIDLKDIGEKTACNKHLNDVPGYVSPFWEKVDCGSCRTNRSLVDRYPIYPKPYY